MDGQRALWSEFFEQLHRLNPANGQLLLLGCLWGMLIHRSTNTNTLLTAKLRGGKAPCICKSSVELLTDEVQDMTRGLHAELTAVWQYDTFHHDWKRESIVPIWI